jgi:hypothetical protein
MNLRMTVSGSRYSGLSPVAAVTVGSVLVAAAARSRNNFASNRSPRKAARRYGAISEALRLSGLVRVVAGAGSLLGQRQSFPLGVWLGHYSAINP